MRLACTADPDRWLPVTGSLGLRGRRARRAAIRMLMSQAGAGRAPLPGAGLSSWLASQAVPLLMRRADGRVLAWTWRREPELVAAMATAQELTPQLRIARATMPMQYDDTVGFRTALGLGEKLMVPVPSTPESAPFATYTWDTGSHLITLTAVGGDRERFGTLEPALDELASGIRIVDDIPGGESTVLRLPPA